MTDTDSDTTTDTDSTDDATATETAETDVSAATRHEAVDLRSSTPDAEESASAPADAGDSTPAATPDGAAADANADANASAAQDDYDARAEAKRLIDNVEGAASRAAAADTAIEKTKDHLKQLSQRLQQLRQREQQTDQRITELVEAKAHVKRAPDDQPVMRTFGGGVTTTVPPADAYNAPDADDRVPTVETSDDEADLVDWDGVYDRADLLTDLQETIDSERGTLATLREEQGKVERGIGHAQDILGELQDARDWLGESDDRTTHPAAGPQTQVDDSPRY